MRNEYLVRQDGGGARVVTLVNGHTVQMTEEGLGRRENGRGNGMRKEEICRKDEE